MASTLSIQPLTPEAYARYGDVVMASPRGQTGKPANQGTARRYDAVAALDNLRPGRAEPNLAVFRCSPRPAGELVIELLEKHPRSTQVFIPMNAKRYLVVVALGGQQPDLSTIAAFEASGAQGVSYRPGVWHHPMIALDGSSDFAVLVWEDGSEDDCVVVDLAPDDRRVLHLSAPGGSAQP